MKLNNISKGIITIILALFFMLPISAQLDDYIISPERITSSNSYNNSFNVILNNDYKTISLGTISSGKTLAVSAVPQNGDLAESAISAFGLRNTSTNTYASAFGGWYKDSRITYFKIVNTGNYELSIARNIPSKDPVIIHTYLLDTMDGYIKYDAIEGQSGNYNYVVSNLPESLGLTTAMFAKQYNKSDLKNDIATPFVTTTLIDGSKRLLPLERSRFLEPDVNSTQKIQLTENLVNINAKLENNKKLTLFEMNEYKEFVTKNNLKVNRTLSVADTSQLGEYGYYLSKSRINGNANVYWEHVNQYGTDMYFGILLENTGNTNINVTLNKRSYDSTDESGPPSLNSIWLDYFRAVKQSDLSDLSPNGTLTIPPNTAKWVALYTVSNNEVYSIFNGQICVSIKNANGSAYTGNNLYCYSFIMSDWINPSGQTMYQTVKANIGNGNFIRAAGAPEESKASHISGSGNGARLVKTFSNIIDITNNHFAFILTGFDAPNINSGELISLQHAGTTSGGESANGYTVNNSCNYGVIYKICFAGINTTQASKNIKLKIKYNPLVNPQAAKNANGGAVFVTIASNKSTYPVCSAIVGDPQTGYTSEFTAPWNITKNSAFELYIVVSGMSSMPPEVEFVEV